MYLSSFCLAIFTAEPFGVRLIIIFIHHKSSQTSFICVCRCWSLVKAGVITLVWLIVVLQLPKFIYEAHYLQNNCILHAKRTKVKLAILIVLLHNHRGNTPRDSRYIIKWGFKLQIEIDVFASAYVNNQFCICFFFQALS